jgi:hypothetical protein
MNTSGGLPKMDVKEIEWQFDARTGKTRQAIECQADIHWRSGSSSVIECSISNSQVAETNSGSTTLSLHTPDIEISGRF